MPREPADREAYWRENVRLDAQNAELRAEIERLTAERANRYWEGRWRDEKADNERLQAACEAAQQAMLTAQQAMLAAQDEIERLKADNAELQKQKDYWQKLAISRALEPKP